MIQFDLNHPEDVKKWVADRIEGMTGRGFGASTAIGMIMNGQPIAGCVYHNFQFYEDGWNVIEISMAANSPRWATKSAMAVFLSYPFKELKCGVAVLRIPRKNKRARRFVKGIGFKEAGMIPRLCGKDDGFVYAMKREDATRWIDGQKR